jgi:hypothetical protein
LSSESQFPINSQKYRKQKILHQLKQKDRLAAVSPKSDQVCILINRVDQLNLDRARPLVFAALLSDSNGI